jgi:UDPglucose 6-dehydrogenase
VRGKTIALLGLTFKADNDDMRDAVSIQLAQAQIDEASILKAYDPVANERAKALLPQCVRYCGSVAQAAEDADAIVIVTDWQQFAEIDFTTLKARMRAPIIIDLRNFLNEKQVRGFKYFSIGGPRRQAFEKAWPRATPEKLRRSHDSKWTVDCDPLGEQILAAE